jgi:hypothetical protein
MKRKTILKIVFVAVVVLICLAIRHVRQSNLENFDLVKAVVTYKNRGGNYAFVYYRYAYEGRTHEGKGQVTYDIIYSNDLEIGDSIMIKVSLAHPEISEIEDLFPH